jgi:hypothetical protein
LLAFGLVGCGLAPRGDRLAKALPQSDSNVSFPVDSPTTVAVLEKRSKHSIEQKAVLEKSPGVSGQNFFKLTVYDSGANQAGDENASGRPNVGSHKIDGELKKYIPDARMKRSLLYAENKYGPFGFATGVDRAGNTCTYAWQNLDGNPQLLERARTFEIRLRLCEPRAASEDAVRVMEGFTIVGYPSAPRVQQGHPLVVKRTTDTTAMPQEIRQEERSRELTEVLRVTSIESLIRELPDRKVSSPYAAVPIPNG